MLRAPSIPSRSWLLLLLSLPLLAGCGPVSSDRGAGGGDLGTSFVVVLADDLGWADISCQGSEWETPAIDALARRGLRVARAYSNGPNCAPSRAYLMTGRDMTSHGIFTVAPSARGKAENRKLDPPPTRRALPDGAATIATELGEAGYRTAHIGKWHLGSDPRAHGFERAVAGNQRGSPKTHLAPWGLPDLPEGAKGTELADALTDQAIDFIEECGEEPFLLVLSHYAVHTPVQADPARVRQWQEKLPEADRRRWRYAALVESVDRSVGRLVDALERTGRAGDTLVIFTSDSPTTGHSAVRRGCSTREGSASRSSRRGRGSGGIAPKSGSLSSSATSTPPSWRSPAAPPRRSWSGRASCRSCAVGAALWRSASSTGTSPPTSRDPGPGGPGERPRPP